MRSDLATVPRAPVVRGLALALAGAMLAPVVAVAQDGADDPAADPAVGSLPMGRLVWTSDRARDGGLNVWLLEAGASEPRRLTSGDVNDFTAEISPDGSMLAFASDRDNPSALTASGSYLRAYDIYRAPLDGGDPERVYGDRTFKMGPTWSPDGALIAYDGEDPDGEQVPETGGLTPQVWVVASDGSGPPRMLTDEAGGADDPTWSPDGSRVAYASVQDGRIMLMAADGSDPVPLTDGPGDAEPAWSPDGTRIVFSSDRSGDRELYVIAADGGEATRLTDSPDFDGQPTWSPDGTMIAFTTDRGPSRDVYLMNADGSDPVNLSGNGPSEDGEHRGSDFSPSWSE
jgi:Tol biopolymer transport system component